MAVTTTNLGVITAYGDAVAAGYTGTKAEWQALMASYATVAEEANQAKDDAVSAKNTAVAKATEATTAAATANTAKDTATSKATEATTAANTATTKANEASASAQSIAQSASQIAQNTSDISELKEDLTNNEGWLHSVTSYNDWHKIDVVGDFTVGDVVYIRAFETDDVSYYNIDGCLNGALTTLYANQTSTDGRIITIASTFDTIRVAYKCTSVATVTMSAIIKKLDNSISGMLIDTIVANSNTQDQLDGVMESPFTVAVNSALKGIVAFEFLDYDSGYLTTEVERYRLKQWYYKSAGFYLYASFQKYVDGAWSNFDSIMILTADAPTEKELMFVESKYHRLKMAYIPSLLTASGIGAVEYPIKSTARQPFITYLQNQINTLNTEQQYGDYELMDEIKNVVHVNADGTGDYTTIAAAYAAITDSSFLNQYEVIVHDGTYSEYNLICPPYTHTHGMNPGSVTVTSEGVSSTLPVFDQRAYPSKLSNMTIISGTGYCIHNDYNFINTGAVVNENLYCKKVYGSDVTNFGWISFTNPAIIGAGAQYLGTKIVYNNCTFEDGEVACHSNSNSTAEGNFHLVLKNCKVVNAWVQLQMAGNSGAAIEGHWVCEIDGLVAPVGCPSLVTKVGARTNDETWFGWQIIGGNNRNFAVVLDDSYTSTTSVPWKNVNTNEKIYVQVTEAVTAGQWIDDTFGVCDAEASGHDVCGVVLADGASGDTVPVWVGNAYSYTASDGEYGIGSNGALSSSATEKIGKVVRNIFYRY